MDSSSFFLRWKVRPKPIASFLNTCAKCFGGTDEKVTDEKVTPTAFELRRLRGVLEGDLVEALATSDQELP